MFIIVGNDVWNIVRCYENLKSVAVFKKILVKLVLFRLFGEAVLNNLAQDYNHGLLAVADFTEAKINKYKAVLRTHKGMACFQW